MIEKRNGILFKIVSIILVALFLFQSDYILCIENVDSDYIESFKKAIVAFKKGKGGKNFYEEAKEILYRLETLLINSDTTAEKELLDKVYLLYGAVHEKLGELETAENKYRKVELIKGIEEEGVYLDDLELYRKIVKGEEIRPQTNKIKGQILKEKKKKKFPVLLVAGGAAVVVAAIILLTKKKKSSPTPEFVTSTDSINVPEGGTNAFDVRLSTRPSSDVSVTVTRVSGDTDITVQSGSNLTFTTANWSQNQTVTLSASEDVDISNGTAAIRISAPGLQNKDLTATEQDNNVILFVTEKDIVNIPEGETNTFTVKLSNQPTADVQAAVTWVSDDADISVQSGGSLIFNTSNWNIPQTVTLRAAEDADTADGQATIRISAAGIQDKDITAIEDDNDSGGCNISISITSPLANATVSGTVMIQASVTGNCVVDEVKFYIDSELKATDTAAPYSYDWETITAFEGPHVLKVTAHSTTGKTAASQITVTVTR